MYIDNKTHRNVPLKVLEKTHRCAAASREGSAAGTSDFDTRIPVCNVHGKLVKESSHL